LIDIQEALSFLGIYGRVSLFKAHKQTKWSVSLEMQVHPKLYFSHELLGTGHTPLIAVQRCVKKLNKHLASIKEAWGFDTPQNKTKNGGEN
jgi:hypothetical protein